MKVVIKYMDEITHELFDTSDKAIESEKYNKKVIATIPKLIDDLK